MRYFVDGEENGRFTRHPEGMMMPGREYQAQPSRFGFNGKENDNEVKGFGNQQDYGMRILDTRLGRFLSIDPIKSQYPWYTPYQFAGNKPIWKTDVDGLEEVDNNNAQYWQNQPQIDMTNAPAKGKNAAQIPRNGLWMARQSYAEKPQMFSEAAKNAMFVENRMPTVDEQWIKHNPTHGEYKGQSLIHHHIDGGNKAVLIPKGLHYDRFSQLHAYLKRNINGAKIRGTAGGLMTVLGSISMFNFKNPDAWINAFGYGEKPEDYKGKVKKDFMNGVYVEINDVVIERSPVIEDGKQVYNKDGSPKAYISRRIVTGTFYSNMIYDEDAKQYKGVDKIETRTEEWMYDQKGNRVVIDQRNKG